MPQSICHYRTLFGDYRFPNVYLWVGVGLIESLILLHVFSSNADECGITKLQDRLYERHSVVELVKYRIQLLTDPICCQGWCNMPLRASADFT